MDVKHIINNLPQLPGVYQFYNSEGKILYIGKAKNLKSRVSSYFNKSRPDSLKTRKLANQVYDIKHIIVESEADALLLENNLIKQFQPKYNILLKDDKTFPWICIKNESFPRIFSTRSRIKDGSEYFGPYTSAYMVKTLLNLIHQIYRIRTCKYSLLEENIAKHKFKVCLQYHIGNCLGPCEGFQMEKDYNAFLLQIKKILKGNLQEVLDYLYKIMLEFSSKQMFEEAEKVKEKYELLKKYKSKSTIVSSNIHNVDVFSYYEDEKRIYVNFLKILEGAIVQSHNVEISNRLDESKEELLQFAIIDIREKVFSNSRILILPFKVELENMFEIIIPKIGDKKKLLDLSYRNAKQYAHQRNLVLKEISSKFDSNKLLEIIKKDLRLSELPKHIECFDNSNIQGTSPVAACVVFLNGKPAKKEYRHFHIKTVIGANDFASMEEILERRYSRLVNEKKDLPQLIIVDGGKGQLSASVNCLKKLGLYEKIAVIGIAKRLEEIYFPGDSIPIYIDKNSKTLKLIQHMRNEAHRFGITFHRDVRSKNMLKNELNDIKGIGDKSIEKLIKEFGSIENLKGKSIEEIKKIVNENAAKNIVDFLRNSNSN